MEKLATYFIVGLICWIGLCWLRLTKNSVEEFILNQTSKFLGKSVYRRHQKIIQNSQTSRKKTIGNSNIYKLLEEIIRDLDLKNVNVEGFLTFITGCSIIICVVIYVFLFRSVIMSILSFPICVVLLIGIAYMKGGEKHFTRQYAIMDAFDAIASDIDRGVVQAIEGNISLFNPEIQSEFEGFLTSVRGSTPVAKALDDLSMSLGNTSTYFISHLKNFEEREREGSKDIIKDVCKENTEKRNELYELQAFLKRVNSQYLACLTVVGVMTLFIISMNHNLFVLATTTLLGRLLLLGNLTALVVGFIYLQSLRNID